MKAGNLFRDYEIIRNWMFMKIILKETFMKNEAKKFLMKTIPKIISMDK